MDHDRIFLFFRSSKSQTKSLYNMSFVIQLIVQQIKNNLIKVLLTYKQEAMKRESHVKKTYYCKRELGFVLERQNNFLFLFRANFCVDTEPKKYQVRSRHFWTKVEKFGKVFKNKEPQQN